MKDLLIYFIILPLAIAFLIPIAGRFIKGFQKTATCIILLFLTVLSIILITNSKEAQIVYYIGGWTLVEGVPIGIQLLADGLTLFVLLIVNLIGLCSAFYAISYINKFTSTNNFYTLFCLMVAGMNGVVLAGDIFNMFVFLEIAVIASYALVAFGVQKEELEASFKYQVLGGMASMLIIFAIGLLYWFTGTLNITDISKQLTGSANKIIIFAQIVMITGFGLKAAMIPFHAWLPDAHSSAPSPISAMLSGVLIKAVGIYVILRLFFNMFEINPEVAITITSIGTLSMIIGVILAIGQWDIKRLLAYHSISQMGYVILGVGIGMMILAADGSKTLAALSISGGLFHLINHAVFKGLLFLTAGAIEHETGTRNLKEMGGLAEKMPYTSTSSFVAAMSISGIPPFNGFFSKLLIIVAAVQAQYYWLAFLAVIVSIVTLASFMKVQKFAFYNGPSKSDTLKEVPFTMRFSMGTLAVLCLVLSLLIIPGIRETFLDPAVEVLLDASKDVMTASK